MPRNGSGSYSLPEAAFVPNTPISSSAVNSDLSDIGDTLTASLARDGQGGMTAVLPLANTGFTYLTDPNTGMRRTAADTQAISVGGIDIMTFTASASLLGGTFQINAGTNLVDGSVSLRKLYHPTATSVLLGSDSNAALVITGAAASGGLIRLTVASTTTFLTGQSKTVSDVVGTTEANGTWTITVVDATHIDLQGSTFVNAYVSGGTIGGGFEQISLGAGLTLTGSVLGATINPALIQDYISGLTLSTSGPSANFSIATGAATDSTNAASMVLAAALTKTTASWVVGTGNGGLDTGAIAANTWYHAYLITRLDTGVVDVIFSTNASSPTLPANYTLFRRIGSLRTNAGSLWLIFSQFGDEFLWAVSINDVSTSNPGTAAILETLTVPLGVQVIARYNALISDASGTAGFYLFTSPDVTDQAPALGIFTFRGTGTTLSGGSGQLQTRTNTSSQVRFRADHSNATVTVVVTTEGWIDHRGKR